VKPVEEAFLRIMKQMVASSIRKNNPTMHTNTLKQRVRSKRVSIKEEETTTAAPSFLRHHEQEKIKVETTSSRTKHSAIEKSFRAAKSLLQNKKLKEKDTSKRTVAPLERSVFQTRIPKEAQNEKVTLLIEIIGAVKLSSYASSSSSSSSSPNIRTRGFSDRPKLQDEPSLILDTHPSSEDNQDGRLDFNATNPYITVLSKQDNNQSVVKLHKTKVVYNDIHPIYTLATGSLFLYETSLLSMKEEEEGELHFNIWNKNKSTLFLSSDESLGKVIVPVNGLLDLCNEERIECCVLQDEMRSWKDVLNLQGGVGVGENEMMNGTVQDEETRRREQLKYCLKKSGGHVSTMLFHTLFLKF